mmetsp:Transcript_8911/g.26752  ORF Transcript_8911/g.26752 Transcript_8911/m.26752 type:complete len:239 (-) Transcript_8911:107-823(-)
MAVGFIGGLSVGPSVKSRSVGRNGRTRPVVVATAATRVGSPPIYFVLGGPGSGKGTQCGRLVSKFGLVQVCAGDLLRERARDRDELGLLIEENIRTGKIVPGKITIDLLRCAVARNKDVNGILVDGFPREVIQARVFEKQVAKARSVIYFNCSAEEMKRRIRSRGLTSGRVDDNDAVVEKRLRTYNETTVPVIDYYRRKGRIHEFDAEQTADEVFEDLSRYFENELDINLSNSQLQTA